MTKQQSNESESHLRRNQMIEMIGMETLIEYLTEGNNKEDLATMYINNLSDKQVESLIDEVVVVLDLKGR